MGSSTSKPETKVFTPGTPIDFSASFLSQLESSPESNYSRAQYTEKYIQDRVASELKKLELETIKEFKKTTNDSLINENKNNKNSLSVPELNEKVGQLTELLNKNAKLAKIEIPNEVQDARNQVVACLKENKGKSLNCWDEVENFKHLVKNL
ncbi:unnamed protein product [Candida verbasci]|uniref:MICOS complex subunit MIC19 n=1 Tax=Candida verbasci TaxID=1227364 RepID=A0A9W4TU94_9ASCO|nr:unnamed protein product [Candida verbasci]